MKKNSDKSDIYKLWWEFLMLSEDYRDICHWHREGRDITKLPEKFILADDISPDEAKRIYPYDIGTAVEIDDKVIHVSPIYVFFGRSGDIYSMSFKAWRSRMIRNAKLVLNSENAVQDYTGIIGKDIDRCVAILKMRHGREPTINELKDTLQNQLLKGSPKVLLEIDPVGQDPERISAEITKIIRQRQREPRIRNLSKARQWFSSPTAERIRLSQLKRYLEVYQIWNKWNSNPVKSRSWTNTVIEKINHFGRMKERDTFLWEIRNEIKRDKKRAERIIGNAERGIFPGNY